MNSRIWVMLASFGVIAAIAGIPAGYASYMNANLRNIRTVKSGVLYRSGQLSLSGLQKVVQEHGIRTVVSLRDSDSADTPPPDLIEQEFCKSNDIRHVRITPRSWWPEYNGPAPVQRGIDSFLEVMDRSENYPVLLHCFAGTHRTGAMVAVYRMEYDRWTNSEALQELRNCGYKNLDRELDVLTFLETYRPRWQRSP